jgi:RimJ/RimL family protein N-acetyltransferase
MSASKIPGLVDISAREAGSDDNYEMWVWWNDPTTRQMMKLNGYVPWEEHCAWFLSTLTNPKRLLAMIVCRFGKIGVVRHDDKGDGIFETSVHFNPLFRGQGLGPKALLAGREFLLARRNVRFQFATLKKINIASQKSFERAGYIFGAPPAGTPGLDRFEAADELFCLWSAPSQPPTKNSVP